MSRPAHGVAWATALVALWIYIQTLSPTVAWMNQGEDSGDLLAAAATLGIPHPTGYPLFVLLGRLASLLPLGSVAFRINLISALAGAAGVYFLVRFVIELTAARDASPASDRVEGGANGDASTRSPLANLVAPGSAALAALLYAFARGPWSQSVVAEVYTLNIAFFGAVLWAVARFERTSDVRWLALASFVWGVGLANHLLLLAAAPALAWSAFRALASRRIGTVGLVLLPLLALWGATLVLYLPVRAGVGWASTSGIAAGKGPEFSWGVPSTPDRLRWVMTGAQYQRNFFARNLGGVARHLVPGRWWEDFGPGLIWLVAGFGAALFVGRRRRLGVALVALAAALALYSLYTIADDVGYWMPVAWLTAALAAVGVSRVVTATSAPAWVRVAVVAVLVLALGDGVRRFPATLAAVDASKDLTPFLYATRNLAVVEPDALIVSEYDGRTFSLWFYKATEFKRSHPRLVVAYKYLLVWPWYLHQMAHVYPWLRVPAYQGDLDDMMNRFIAKNVDQRPVYLTRLDPGLASVFRADPVGYPAIPLYRVTRVKP